MDQVPFLLNSELTLFINIMNNSITKFFERYKEKCEKFNRGKINIPKPDPENGTPGKNIILMFINERPGRVGPGQTGIVSFDNPDPSAQRFKRLFETLSIDRKRIFITNACIYYPLDKNYRDKSPTNEEIDFSKNILKKQIERVRPKIIVPLGNTASRTLKKVFPKSSIKNFRLKVNVGNMISDTTPYIIYPLYHTSSRASLTRKEEDQKKDWVKLKDVVKEIAENTKRK